MSDVWDILGIAPTSDKAAIKKAYATKLKDNKPDKNPEGFTRLRAAYEQALATCHFYQNAIVREQSSAKTSATKDAALIQAYDDTKGTDNADIDNADVNNKNPDTDTPTVIQNSTLQDNAQQADVAQLPIIDESQQIAVWRAKWQAIVAQYINTDTDTNTSQNQQYAHADHALHQCLVHQFNALQALSLDARLDYEVALFAWLEAQPPLFTLSYTYASTFFDWKKHIKGWDTNEYPWFLMRAVYERYMYASNFSDKDKFKSYLAYHYPLVHRVWDFEVAHPNVPSRLRLFSFLYTNPPAPLLQQIDALQYDLNAYSAQQDQHSQHDAHAIDTQYNWLNPAQLTTLKHRVSDSFLNKQDLFSLVIVAMLWTGLCWLITRAPWPAQTFIVDTLGVYVVVLVGLSFWQLQLHLFTKPYRFIIDAYTPLGTMTVYRMWRNVSIAIWLSSCLIYKNIDPTALLLSTPTTVDTPITITSPFTMSYFIGHVVGLVMLIAINAKNDNTLSMQLYWYIGLILFVFAAVLQPMDFMTTTNLNRTFNGTSPMLWGLLVIPLVLDQLAIKLGRIRFILTAFSVWLTGAWVFFAILAVLGAIAVSIEVFSTLNLPATLLTWLLMLVFLVGYLVTSLNRS